MLDKNNIDVRNKPLIIELMRNTKCIFQYSLAFIKNIFK